MGHFEVSRLVLITFLCLGDPNAPTAPTSELMAKQSTASSADSNFSVDYDFSQPPSAANQRVGSRRNSEAEYQERPPMNFTGNKNEQYTCEINDPLGQTHIHSSSDHYFHLSFILFCKLLKIGYGRTDEETTRAEIVITTGRDCGSASWINIHE